MRTKRNAYLSDDEPRLQDVLDDPVVQAMMARDGVGRDEIVDLALAVQAKFSLPAQKYSCCV